MVVSRCPASAAIKSEFRTQNAQSRSTHRRYSRVTGNDKANSENLIGEFQNSNFELRTSNFFIQHQRPSTQRPALRLLFVQVRQRVVGAKQLHSEHELVVPLLVGSGEAELDQQPRCGAAGIGVSRKGDDRGAAGLAQELGDDSPPVDADGAPQKNQ